MTAGPRTTSAVIRWTGFALRVAACLLVQPLVERPARAEPGIGTRLQYARSENAVSCPNEAELRAAVRQRLGYDPFFPAARQTIVVEIADQRAQLVGRVTLVDAEGIIRGARELSEPSGNCGELIASLALAISITLDPATALGPVEAPAQTEPEVTPAPAAEISAPAADVAQPKSMASERPPIQPERTTHPSAAPGVKSGLRGGGLLAFGVVPSAVLAARLGARFRVGRLSLAAEGLATLPGSESSTSGGNVRAQLFAASLAPCLTWSWLSGCGLLILGDKRAWGAGLANTRSVHLMEAAVGARIEVSVGVTPAWALLLNADASRSLTPSRLRLQSQEVWTTPALSAALGAGLEFHFP